MGFGKKLKKFVKKAGAAIASPAGVLSAVATKEVLGSEKGRDILGLMSPAGIWGTSIGASLLGLDKGTGGSPAMGFEAGPDRSKVMMDVLNEQLDTLKKRKQGLGTSTMSAETTDLGMSSLTGF